MMELASIKIQQHFFGCDRVGHDRLKNENIIGYRSRRRYSGKPLMLRVWITYGW